MSKEHIFSFIHTPESALQLRNALLCLAVPGAIWIIHNVIFRTGSILSIQDSSLDSIERANIAIGTVVAPWLTSYIPLKLSEFAHERYRQLDSTSPPSGLAEQLFYDPVVGNKAR